MSSDTTFPPHLRDIFQPEDDRPMKLALVRLNELAQQHCWTLNGLTNALQGITPQRAIGVLQRYGSVLTANEAGEAPIHAAAALPDENQAVALMAALVNEQPTVVNAVSRHGVTPLDQALRRSGPAVAQWLLERGANPNGVEPPPNPYLGRTTASRRVPLVTVVEDGVPDQADAMVALLLHHGAQPRPSMESGNVPLVTAVRRGLRSVVVRLISADPAWDTPLPNGDRLLHVAASLPNEVHKDLLAAGADPNARDRSGRTSLHRAAAMNVSGSEHATRRNRSATTGSKRFAPTHGVEAYLQKSWNAEATESDRLFTVRDLLAAGADVNVQDNAGHTALSRLVQHPRSIDWHLVEHLVKAGADLDIQPKGFNEPLRARVLGDNAPDHIKNLAHIVERHALNRAVLNARSTPTDARVRNRL